jgi:hypothetical protein
MDQHLTVTEARKLTGKSDSTIKRMIRDIVSDAKHPERSFILPSHDEVERRKKQPRQLGAIEQKQQPLTRAARDRETTESFRRDRAGAASPGRAARSARSPESETLRPPS